MMIANVIEDNKHVIVPVKSANILYETYLRVFCNNTKSLANKTTNFVNESHLLI